MCHLKISWQPEIINLVREIHCRFTLLGKKGGYSYTAINRSGQAQLIVDRCWPVNTNDWCLVAFEIQRTHKTKFLVQLKTSTKLCCNLINLQMSVAMLVVGSCFCRFWKIHSFGNYIIRLYHNNITCTSISDLTVNHWLQPKRKWQIVCLSNCVSV